MSTRTRQWPALVLGRIPLTAFDRLSFLLTRSRGAVDRIAGSALWGRPRSL